MRQTSVRLPGDLVKLMEADDKPDSDIIRDALRMYYKVDTRPATVDDIRKYVTEHENRYHTRDAVEDALLRWGGLDALKGRLEVRAATNGETEIESCKPEQIVPLPGIDEVAVEIESQPEPAAPTPQKSPEEIRREQTIMVLESLLKFLGQDKEIVSGTIAEDTGIPTREIGRILRGMGMEAKNTRIDNVPGRYWGFDCEPTAKKELERLKGELKVEADKEVEIKT